MEEEYERLAKAGVEFTMKPTKTVGAIIAVFNDTCGNLIQIHQTTESLYHFYIDYVNYYVENLKQQNKSGEGSIPSFNYISLIFDAIKLFPDFQERLQESKKVQLNSWKAIITVARNKGEIKSPMTDEEIANMFINSSGGVEMNSIFIGNSEDVGKNLINVWDSFYKVLKA